MLPQEKLNRIVSEVRKAAASQSDAAALSFLPGKDGEDHLKIRGPKERENHSRNISGTFPVSDFWVMQVPQPGRKQSKESGSREPEAGIYRRMQAEWIRRSPSSYPYGRRDA